MKDVIIDKLKIDGDFVPLFSGEERCKSGHTFGPYVRDYTLIHFCLSGKGVLFDKYGSHKISAGDLFIIREGEITTYSADKDDPWHYIWIATRGRRAEEIEERPSVIHSEPSFFERIKEAVDENATDPDIYSAYLHELLFRTSTRGADCNADKLSKIRRYIRYNYMMHINVDSIGALFGFERSYLYRIFKKRYGIGVKEYLISVRMEKAKELLEASYSVGSASELVGYSDEFSFSKAFKLYSGISPSAYKREAARNR